MPVLKITPPDPSEYAPYFGRYIALVRDTDILHALSVQMKSTLRLLSACPPRKGDFRYAPGKWTLKEVMRHIIDSERVFAYRAMSFARADATPLPGYEQDDWMKAINPGGSKLSELLEEFEYVRRGNILFFRQLTREEWMRRGTANGNPYTVRAAAYVIAGHELHHCEILRTKYLNK